MINSTDLVAALQRQVLTLEDDLRERLDLLPADRERWQDEHRRLLRAERTAAGWTAWRDDRVTQAAVAWVLTTVFIRFCEDNRLVRPVWISGPVERRREATDAQLAHFRTHPDHTDREWLQTAIAHLARLRATAPLVEEHSPLWTISPSGQAVTDLLQFWRRTDDAGELIFDFTDPELSTRFLGDLYQDLSDHAKRTFALLQTPEFVEEFILDQTLEPALTERPLDGFTIIDPTCGSGHFLLGAFHRLLDRWDRQAPALDRQERVRLAVESVYGVDINPFAVAIAQFRLTVAVLLACGLRELDEAPAVEYHVVAGDSLLFGRDAETLPFEGADYDQQMSDIAYTTEDVDRLKRILTPGQYDVVVGNPPYITVKDKHLNKAYRALYPTCKGTYALTVPFMERFFALAKPARGDQPAGWTGQITSNSFMKREFGSKLIEEFLVAKDLRLVADTSGAYIPGHGTPTVIITGRNQRPVGSTVRAVLGIRGEPGRPADPAEAMVWSSIVDHVGDPGHEDQWLSVSDLDRSALRDHPWSLSGGGATDLLEVIEQAPSQLGRGVDSIGRTTVVGEDDAWFIRGSTVRALNLENFVTPIVVGENVRDYAIGADALVLWPYVDVFKPSWVSPESVLVARCLWPNRSWLEKRVIFGKTLKQRNRPWYDHLECYTSKMRTPLGITYAEVATHNHFVLDRGGKVFKQTAPVIKLPEAATEDDHLGLLGVLNSSTACFWLKQNCYNKGNGGIGGGIGDEDWEPRYQFGGTTLQDYPLPETLPRERARSLDRLATSLSAAAPEQVVEGVPTAATLAQAAATSASIRGRMIAEQEELDWAVYGLYGLPGGELVHQGDDLPEIALGERAFEIALARKVAAGEEETAWFARHGSTPITEIPAHWPEAYRDLVQRRLDLIEADAGVALLESPEHKRRWSAEPWQTRQDRALRGWLLDRLEDRAFWFSGPTPTPKSVAQLADAVGSDADLVSVLQLWEGRPDVPVVDSLTRLLTDEAVPYLAALRLKEPGLRKRRAWEETWQLQRREDAGEDVGPIPVPPKYTTADFRKQSWWQHRGKLDVPKERFILYPDAGRVTDPTLLLGWAGWDHAEQSLALAAIIAAREEEGRPDDDLVPLVAGLAELQPWVAQWHSDIHPVYGQSLAVFCQEQLDERSRQVNQSIEQLAAWRPAARARKSTPRKSARARKATT
ncbi:BREX-2 system adenine-specific DNA-methyltransferase PglX [Propionibacteriaceae bacterium Y2011]